MIPIKEKTEYYPEYRSTITQYRKGNAFPGSLKHKMKVFMQRVQDQKLRTDVKNYVIQTEDDLAIFLDQVTDEIRNAALAILEKSTIKENGELFPLAIEKAHFLSEKEICKKYIEQISKEISTIDEKMISIKNKNQTEVQSQIDEERNKHEPEIRSRIAEASKKIETYIDERWKGP